jgi:acetyl-CoA C-acetyltransferase
VGATGVGQVATCARLLEGRYPSDLQPEVLPKYALADTHGGVCTSAAVTILQGRGAA